METVEVNGKKFKVKIAKTDEERIKGLQDIKHLPEDEGMLFVFDEPQTVDFWMKDTYIPLDIIFINEDCEVISVYKGEPENTDMAEENDVKYVLEVNQNSGIKEGDTITVAFRVSQSKEDRYVHFEFNSAGGLVGDYYANTLPSKLELKPESKMTFFVDGFPFESPDLRWKFETVSGTVYMVCLDHPELRAPRIAK